MPRAPTDTLHARCCRSWVLTKGEDDALCPYCRTPVKNGRFSIGELPAAPAPDELVADDTDVAPLGVDDEMQCAMTRVTRQRTE